ncbi:hypothetical protein DFJ77DRAFT_305309 [Powellomyces hirtus]|nr:hypothetical protein DFJ77DRAFT_305309 [Powellomyces hirtus]
MCVQATCAASTLLRIVSAQRSVDRTVYIFLRLRYGRFLNLPYHLSLFRWPTRPPSQHGRPLLYFHNATRCGLMNGKEREEKKPLFLLQRTQTACPEEKPVVMCGRRRTKNTKRKRGLCRCFSVLYSIIPFRRKHRP